MSEKSIGWPDSGIPGLATPPEEILVRCPRCAGPATSAPRPRDDERRPYESSGSNRQLLCRTCPELRHWQPRPMHVSHQAGIGTVPAPLAAGPVDAYFGLPLWLQTTCRDRILWAYNGTHLDLLTPTWLAERGSEAVRAVNKLRALLVDQNTHHAVV